MDDLTPEQLEQLIALGIIPDEQAGLNQQMDQANQLRNTPIPKGGMAGRVYVGDPFGALAAGFDRYQGNKQIKQIQGQQKDLMDKQMQARMAYVNLLRNPPKKEEEGLTNFYQTGQM